MQEPRRAASIEPAIDTFPLHRQRNSTRDPGAIQHRQSSFDIGPRCTCLDSELEARESEIENPASNSQRSASTYSENRREEVQRAGYRGFSAQFDGTRKELLTLVDVFTDFQAKPERKLSSEDCWCLQDIGQREPLFYRLFVAEPELYHIEPIPAPPPSFPANILERALHDAGISTHTEYPVDDPAVIQGTKEMGGMDFPVFWLANYRNEDLNACGRIIFRSGLLFVTAQGDLAAWTEEDGATILGNKPYGIDVEKAVVKWAMYSLRKGLIL
ncbi:hypothetical protein EV426DRAFT_571512 [Tirmania nivea]|nr:hypothetical protein EV426DRAFT_571512 [Tirmania nivea]